MQLSATRLSAGGPSGGLSLMQRALSAIRRNNGSVWWVPDNLTGSGIFTDSTGITPASTVGDVLGLITDRSYGAGNLGPELFSDAAVVFSGESSRVSPGVYRVYSSAGAYTAVTQTVGSVGKSYRIEFTVDSVAVAGGGIALDVGGFTQFTFPSAIGKKTLHFAIAGSAAWSIKRAVGATDAQISNISVREVLGNHATQPTTASKPVIALNAQGRKVISFDGSNHFLQTGITTGNEGWMCAGVTPANTTKAMSIMNAGEGTTTIPGVWLFSSGGSAWAASAANGTDRPQAFHAMAGTSAQVVGAGWSASSVFVEVNGAESAPTARTGNCSSGANVLRIGLWNGSSNPLNATATAFIYCPVLPSAADRATIRRWVGSLQGQQL